MPDQRIARAFERLVEDERLSRRAFVGRLGVTGAGITGLSVLLAACGGVEGEGEDEGAGERAAANHPRVPIDELRFSNWPLYIDKSVIRDFNRRFGAEVRYVEEINDNIEFFARVRQQLRRDQSIGRDLVVLTDYMAARWIRSGYVEPLDKGNIPNARNLVAELRTPRYDRDRSFSLPWQSGATGIGYDPRRVGRRLNSVNDLFDPDLKGRVSFLSEPYDSASLVMLGQGVDPSRARLDDVMAAIDRIEEAQRRGQIRRFTGNDYTGELANGNLWASVAYSGDLIQLQADNPQLEFLFPDEGAVLWTDNMLMPEKAPHPYAAETMMNYVYDPQVAAKIAAYVNYIPPVDGVQEILARRDRELAENPLIFPSAEQRRKLRPYPTLTPEQEREMQSRMAEVVGA